MRALMPRQKTKMVLRHGIGNLSPRIQTRPSDMGYSPAELDAVQARWDLRFPPDLVELLREHRPIPLPGCFDWLSTDAATIQAHLDWPFDSFWFGAAWQVVARMGRETVEPRRAARSVEAAICGSAEANSALWLPLPPAGAVRKTNPVFS